MLFPRLDSRRDYMGRTWKQWKLSAFSECCTPVVDIEPNSDDRKVGLGMEVGLFPSRKAAFEQARDERRVIATVPVDLL